VLAQFFVAAKVLIEPFFLVKASATDPEQYPYTVTTVTIMT